jgi:hypothetical protein
MSVATARIAFLYEGMPRRSAAPSSSSSRQLLRSGCVVRHHKRPPTLSIRFICQIASVEEHLSRQTISTASWRWRMTIHCGIESPPVSVDSVQAGISTNHLQSPLSTAVRPRGRVSRGLPAMNKSLPRRLLDRAEAVSYLRLDDDKLQPLIDTRQITPIRISGAERFDLNDLDELIKAYKATASRRK